MADQMPTMDPAELIGAQAEALSARLVQVARDAVKAALERGSPASVSDIVNVLESLTETLPAGLLAVIEAELPEIARQAVIAASVEIADAREQSGKPFPPVSPPPAGDYSGWMTTATAALVASLRKKAEVASAGQTVAVVADAGELSSKILAELDEEISAALSSLFDTATARTVNESRMEVFRSNTDVVRQVKVITIADAKRSEVCTNMNGATFDPKRPVSTPPFHNGCRSYLRAITTAKRKKGATEAEIYRQNWAIYRRLEREAAQAEARADERLELRFAPTADATGTFTGIANAYGVLDAHGTEFAPGSFAANIAERRAEGRKVPLLLHHDPERPCGVVEEMRETPDGLMIEGRFILDTEAGREAHALAKAGAVALSVGFKRIADRARPGGGRIITEARLAEVSIVAVASNPKAAIIEVPGNSPAAGAAQQQENRAMPDSIAAPADTGKDVNARVTALESKVDSIAAAVDEIKAAVTKTEARADKIEARSSRLGLGGGDKPSNDLERRAFVAYLRGGRESLGADETRALRLSDDEAAGYLAPPEFVAEIDKDLAQFSPIRQLATVRNTSRSEVNTLRRTSPATATWVGEDDDRDETEVRYGQQSFPVRELATFVDVSLSLLEDAAVDVAAELSAEFAEAFGLAEGQAFVNGNGVLRPLGFMSDTSLSFTNSGHASQITADSLIDLFHAQKPAYRQNGTWLMNSQTLAACRKLKDSQGRYLVDIGGMAGAPSTTILGRPVLEDPNLPDVGAGAFPVAFGDFRVGFRIFDRIALSIVRDDFTQRTKGRVRFHGRRRVAAGVRRAEAIRKLRISAS